MTLSKIASVSLQGLLGTVVEVEADIADGIPLFNLLGLPDAALSESRDRVRAALTNSGQRWPNKKITISLSPAWLPKSGPGFDCAIALAILVADGALPQAPLHETVVIGELSLEGKLRSVRGALPALIAAYKSGMRRAIVPADNYSEAALVPEMQVLAFSHIHEIYQWLTTGEYNHPPLNLENKESENYLDFADVAGQAQSRFAAEVAAAGGHHLLLIGPPGAGKTMIASRIPTILPPLKLEESLEVTAIHSITDALTERSPLSNTAPFVAPHHTATRTAIVGGGARSITPGAISLAHHGVLFIDEAPECARGILDSLRQPLESGTITIARQVGAITFPAQFLLVLAANPCPCGKFTGKGRGCSCSSLEVRRYLARLSGPLMDRIDIRVNVEPVSRVDLAHIELAESSEVIRTRVIAAREIAAQRFKDYSWTLNSQIPARELRQQFSAERAGMNFLHDELEAERITARGLHKILRLSWTLADLAGHHIPTRSDVEAAYTLRNGGY